MINRYQCKIAVMNALQRSLGERRVMSVYCERALRRYERNGVVFLHIPKAAGTSVCSALYGGRVGHFTLAEVRRARRYARVRHLPGFTIVRDPLSRLLSSYRYASNGGGTEGGMTPDPAYRSTKFRSFASFLEEWLIEQDLHTLDRVFWPQSDFLSLENGRDGEANAGAAAVAQTNNGCGVDFIGKVEDMSRTQRWISEACGLQIDIPHRNQCRSSSSGRLSIDAGQRRMVETLYAADYERLGY